MKNKTIKKSIIFIMITTLLLCSFSVLANNVDDGYVYISFNNLSLTADDIIDLKPDPNSEYYIAHYRVQVVPYAYFKQNGYYNGRIRFRVAASITNPNGPSAFESIHFEMSPVIGDDFFSYITVGSNSNNGSTSCFCYFYNRYSRNQDLIPLAPYFIDFFVQVTGNQDNNINLVLTVSDVADTSVVTSTPTTQGSMAALIAASVEEAINNSDMRTAIDALNILTAGNQSYLRDVISAINVSNSNLANLLFYMQTDQQTDLNGIQTEQRLLYTMLLEKLNTIINMGTQDTQAQNQLNQAASQMENAAAAMEVSKPNIAAVIPETLLAADAAQAQSDIFAWLQNGYILQILIACFTIALIGFVLYGKSG